MTPTDADLAPYGWAPGGYTAPCDHCGRQIAMVGPSAHKRCRTCRPCAVKQWRFRQRMGGAIQEKLEATATR